MRFRQVSRRSLSGSTVVVTGAAGGLGLALCLELGRCGARVIGYDASPDSLEAARARLCAAAVDHELHALDLTDVAGCRRELERLAARRIDGLVLNAGITRIVELEAQTDEDLRRVLEVNFFSPVAWARDLLGPLRAARGFVVGISSVAGFAPLARRTAYAASKHALAGFLETLRSEEPTLDVLAVYPSYLRTGIRDRSAGGPPPRHRAGGVSAEDAAQRVVRAIERRERRLLIGAEARLARLVWTLAPDLYVRLMRSRA
ncbi:MAG: SDR family NAD(P)-dependent oxidoreductase [Polyangiaceae bacterium]|nr:SDR family NAD(P)-dependent oxidoreductase [Polyangiaceae bacterium]